MLGWISALRSFVCLFTETAPPAANILMLQFHPGLLWVIVMDLKREDCFQCEPKNLFKCLPIMSSHDDSYWECRGGAAVNYTKHHHCWQLRFTVCVWGWLCRCDVKMEQVKIRNDWPMNRCLTKDAEKRFVSWRRIGRGIVRLRRDTIMINITTQRFCDNRDDKLHDAWRYRLQLLLND